MAKRNHSSHYNFCKQANKKIMADRIEAELLLEEIQLRARRTIHPEKRSYHCQWGDHWHLTSEELKNDMPHSA